MGNHVINPSFFNDVLETYSFEYDAYVVANINPDEYGMQKATFDNVKVVGSLQNQGTRLSQKSSGNTVSTTFKFYSKSIYRLNIGDFIMYEGKLLHVTDVNPYDEYGVRECTLEMTQLNEHRDLAEFIKLQTGDLRI